MSMTVKEKHFILLTVAKSRINTAVNVIYYNSFSAYYVSCIKWDELNKKKSQLSLSSLPPRRGGDDAASQFSVLTFLVCIFHFPQLTCVQPSRSLDGCTQAIHNKIYALYIANWSASCQLGFLTSFCSI